MEKKRTGVAHGALDGGHHLVDALELALRPALDAVLAADLLQHSGADSEDACASLFAPVSEEKKNKTAHSKELLRTSDIDDGLVEVLRDFLQRELTRRHDWSPGASSPAR